MSQILQFFLDIFRYHKKKILFLSAAISFWFVVLFPYDDLSDFITFKTTQMTQSQLYLQFDGLAFALLPQLGIKMENVLVEVVNFPPFNVDTLGVAPKFSLIFGKLAGVVKASGFFGGDVALHVSPSNQLEADGPELGVDLNLEKVALKDLSKYMQKYSNFPLTVSGETNFDSTLYVDTTYKVQPKGDVKLNIKNLDIPSSNIGLPMGGGAAMSMPLPALQLTNLEIEGNMRDGTFTIKKGTIGDPKNDLNGTITGDIHLNIAPNGRVSTGGYNLVVNLNIGDTLKRQLGTVLSFVDIYQGIGEKYKFDSLRGVRYAMRIKANNMATPPQISAAQ